MIKESEHIDNLIARYLTGEASEDERNRLEKWMNESEENEKYFSDTRFVHDKAVASHKIIRVDVNKAWNSVQGQMHPKTISKPAKRIPLITFWMRIAAVFVLTIGISFWLYRNYHTKSLQPLLIESRNNTLAYKLTDSSRVFMNRHSEITYTADYGKKRRIVNLTGEAYFQVAHNKKKPFIVETEGTFVKDIGTSFNIKAYAVDSIVEVFVESGEVSFYTENNPGILLRKGEKGIYNKVTETFRKFNSAEPNILSYKSKVLIFRNTNLSEVLETLNSIYQTKITANNQELMNCRITVTFDNEDINTIVSIISETLHLQMVKTNDGYELEGDSCNNH